ncbi:GNAT family N-acetyltransferase [candidate division CSSED10-310 bacterium]|uniref:GNAT family N-acetyltransferase n=1 Tax=candidate division CSSED10-310 bacterium TaxID=2855610 RepID=A0ABV6YS20_UNCC1
MILFNCIGISSFPVEKRATADEYATLIDTVIKEKAHGAGLTHFKVWATDDLSSRLFPGYPLTRINKLLFGYMQTQVNTFSTSLDKIQFLPIDSYLLSQKYLQNLEHVVAEIEWMWPSLKRYLEKGFGIVALVSQKIICWCTAEYVSQQTCGVGIETIPDFENKGVGTATAAFFVQHCCSGKITPYWECDDQNYGSIRIAEKVGFTRLCQTDFRVGSF